MALPDHYRHKIKQAFCIGDDEANAVYQVLNQLSYASSTLSSANNIDVGGTLDVTGAATLSSTLAVAGVASLDGNTLATEGGAGVVGDAETYATAVEQVGGLFRTTIVIDLTGLDSSGTANDVIGDLAGGAAHIGQITAARNGTIFGGVIECLETPAGGDTDVDPRTSTAATGVFDDDATALAGAAQLLDHGAWTAGERVPLTTLPAANAYLYLASGSTGDGTYTAGKFVITLYGVPTAEVEP